MHFILLVMLVLAITVASCGGEDLDYVAIAKSFEEAINAGDADAAVSLWAEDGHFEMRQDPLDVETRQITCEGTDEIREFFQTIIDSGIEFRFSNYKKIGLDTLCFVNEYELDFGLGFYGIPDTHLRFEGEKIAHFANGCPGEW